MAVSMKRLRGGNGAAPAAPTAMVTDAETLGELQATIERALIGKPEVVRLALVALLAKGHLLIEDVPGVGKTTLALALARAVGGSFQRIQFTSDLLPADILGTSVYDQQNARFEFRPGPVFANVVLADEINRTTPKTQSSLLEAMNDFQVSLDHHTYRLPEPFLVLATQNPLEHHGTHPLPESQMDRFLLRLRIGYPDGADERRILRGDRPVAPDQLEPVLTPTDVLRLQRTVETVRVDETLLDYLLALVEASRRCEDLALGVSPRCSLALYRAAQAHAYLDGRDYCVPDDVKRLVIPVFAHRVIPRGRWEGSAGGAGAEAILAMLVEQTPLPA
ncbi:MAG TPA: MoxR family ATPase [Candidatus Methylomirabilis sp.]